MNENTTICIILSEIKNRSQLAVENAPFKIFLKLSTSQHFNY